MSASYEGNHNDYRDSTFNGPFINEQHIHPPTHEVGWARLRSLDQEARSGVSRSLIGSDTAAALRLPRETIRDALRTAIASPGDLFVKGDSGVGKSALVMDSIEPTGLGDDRQAIAINLRHLPENHLGLLSQLGNPLDELFAELTAPERILVIDGAEAAAEDHGQVFSHVLRCAREAGLKVIVVAATEGAGTAAELMRSGAAAPREYTVPGLTDEEVTAVAGHFPGLQRLAENSRGRELLRRPIIVDLLGRAGDPGLPLSESEALDHIWRHLVRNSERQGAGAPDAREQVMLRLADHALRKSDVDELINRLDHAAVDGLRRSGLIHPASGLPWERVPEFKHDLLRAYSIARQLLGERDPARALMSVEAPRWALPSARLACEIVLSAPDHASHPLAERFIQLQTRFEEIVTAGHGERWADVPTEALLAVPASRLILKDAWPTLLRDQAQGLSRVIRILHGRHQREGVLDPIIAEPFIIRLLDEEVPPGLTDEVAELIRDWLRAHVLRSTPAGQPTRVALRDAILTDCAENERVLDEQEAAKQAALAARTPEQVTADEEHRKRFSSMAGPFPSRRRRRPETARHRPYLWIKDAQIEHLALLGPDLGGVGEAVLRRVAEDEPHSLDHAVEPWFTGHSLAAYDPALLIDLTAAYYIDDDEDDFGWSSGLDEDGIRHHRPRGSIDLQLASFTHGPFLALLRADYRRGTVFLNRMLNHAARCRVRTLSDLRHEPPIDEETAGVEHTLSITGEPRTYIGDEHVWLWYRGTGVGPYPCMSALQALEFVTEEIIRAGVPVTTLTPILLEGAESLAMPALALGILVRHLEAAEDALDPYLVEPTVWSLEFGRATHDQSGILAAHIPDLANTERRGWSLREVSMMLALRAEGERIEHLKELGNQLLANARKQVGDDSSSGAHEYLAAVQNWAASLDRSAYELLRQDGEILIQQTVNPEVEDVLGETNADLRRGNDAMGLVVRHAHVRDNGGRAPEMTDEALAADLVLARDLLDNPPQSGLGASSDGPVAVAASAVELHLTSRAHVADEDLQWSVFVILGIAAEVAKRPSDSLDKLSFFNQGADRSAGRALPYLLLPAARDLRQAVGVASHEDVQELVELSSAIASQSPNETRIAYARGLDVVWSAPCNNNHLHGRCHHRIALDVVQESFLESVFGPWDFESQRRTVARLDPPTAASLDATEGKDIFVPQLTSAIRATGAAAISSACCREEARQIVESLIAAHQRAMLTFDHGYHHSKSDSLVAARATLWQAINERDEPILTYVDRYLGNSRLLSEGLQAISVAGGEHSDLAEQLYRLWPLIMDHVLNAADANPQIFTEQPWGDYAESALIPNRSAEPGYITLENQGDAHPWRDLISWSPQVERWLSTITSSRMSIDQLVIAIHELTISDQVEAGLRWIEQIVEQSGTDCANTYTLPEWLHERFADLVTDEQAARWQRVVDLLIVAGDSRVADLAD
ncbi:hypothetical protein [Nocardiopsis sp. CC223A]|uniref:hypothetical protein n=1 Tax=Nocardiopsis sp. CC223A TaxID=3044051 RepID=UPI00278C170E|nr:hypothetical protein [Nocardiopsis sp. CC223A]